MRIRSQLLIFILGVVLVGFAAIMVLSYLSSRTVVLTEIGQKAEQLKQTNVQYFDGFFNATSKVAASLAQSVRIDPKLPEGRIQELLKESLRRNPEIYGMTLFKEPAPHERGLRLFAPYYYRKGEVIEYIPADPAFPYEKQSWYTRPKKEGLSLWTEPYFDAGANTVMATYAVPIFSNEGKFIGISTVDIDLGKLSETINRIQIGRTGYALLVSPKGFFLTHPDPEEFVLRQSVQGVAEQSSDAGFKSLAEEMLKGHNGNLTLLDPFTGKRSWATYSLIPSTNYSLVLFIPEEELLTSVNRLSRNIILISIIAVLLITGGIITVSWRITNPIERLNAHVTRVATGNLNEEIPLLTPNFEIRNLSHSFRQMVETIRHQLAALRNERDKFERVFTNMSDGIIATDPQWRVINCNQAAERMLGLSVGANLMQLLSRQFRSTFNWEELFDYQKKEKHFELIRPETEQVRELYFSGVVNTIVDPDGRLTAYVLTLRDITEQKREELNKNTLLSLISHKLRTPLAILNGTASLMADGTLGSVTEKQTDHLKKLMHQTKKVQGLVDRLISYVSITEKKKQLPAERIDLPHILAQLKREGRWDLPGKTVSVSFDTEGSIPPLLFNPGQLQLALSELIENGLKFNRSPDISLKVLAHRKGGRTIIDVHDNGVGIPPLYHEKIFERFFQVDKDFTGNTEGIGLGLALVKLIMESHGGSVLVASREGEGSTFTLEFGSGPVV